nr:MAG TPA: hypothetical protein [Caudoviricetes sp.]
MRAVFSCLSETQDLMQFSENKPIKFGIINYFR